MFDVECSMFAFLIGRPRLANPPTPSAPCKGATKSVNRANGAI